MSETAEIWKKRVASWRASGETAETFSAGRGWSPKTLRWWSSRLGREPPPPVVRIAQLVRTSDRSGGHGAIVVEDLETRVRITIEPGADRDALEVVMKVISSRSSQ